MFDDEEPKNGAAWTEEAMARAERRKVGSMVGGFYWGRMEGGEEKKTVERMGEEEEHHLERLNALLTSRPYELRGRRRTAVSVLALCPSNVNTVD